MCCAFSAGQSSAAGSIGYQEEVSPTLRAAASGTNRAPSVVYCLQGNTIDRRAAQNGAGITEGISYTINTVDRHAVVYRQHKFGEYREGIGTLTAGMGAGHTGETIAVVPPGITRRLTPLECERLQGYPDGWTDIPVYIDSKGRTRHAVTLPDTRPWATPSPCRVPNTSCEALLTGCCRAQRWAACLMESAVFPWCGRPSAGRVRLDGQAR